MFTHISRRYPDGDLSMIDDKELAELIAYIKMRDTENRREIELAAGMTAAVQ